jgi:O-antigen ligase
MAATFVPGPKWLWLRIGVFVLPVVLSAAGGATLAKPTFLVAATLTALVLVQQRPDAYVAFALWLFVLTPGLRHFVDWYAGYSQANPMMLAPYCALVVSFPTGVLYLLNQRRYAGFSAAMLATVAIGAWMTLLTGLIQEPLLTALRWVCPIFLGLYIWTHAENLAEIRASVVRVMRVALPLVSAYGLVQFVSILPWDAYYMKMAPMTSIGWPEPYMVRVFSTMNHSGSFAAFLATGILLLMPRLRGLEFVSILLACCALFTTTQRSAMGALILALLVLLVASRSRTIRAGIRKLAFAAAVAVAVALVVPGMAIKLTSSVGSVTQLNEDGSAQERLAQYAELSARIEEHPFGSGLAWYANRLQNRSGMEATLDSGIIDILVSFGIIGGTLYLALLGMQLALGWRIASWVPDPSAKAEFGIVLYGLSQLPFGVQHAGEHGFFLYLGIGLLLARACVPPESRRPRILNATPGRPQVLESPRSTQWGGLGGATGT